MNNRVTIKAEVVCPYCGEAEEMTRTMHTISAESQYQTCIKCTNEIEIRWTYSAYVTTYRIKDGV
jgi:DNA-directed RNA polymerase subunit M/transcription elongation factor TFIIS